MSSSHWRTALFSALAFSVGCSTSNAGLFGSSGRATDPFDGIAARDAGDDGRASAVPSGDGRNAVVSTDAGASPFYDSAGGAAGYERGVSRLDGALLDDARSSPDAGNLDGSGGGRATDVDATPGTGGTCSVALWYPDNDQDHYGRSTATVSGCTPPSTGTWTLLGGDCDDDDPLVFPAQTRYFTLPFAGIDGQPSYDYDCDGIEAGDPSEPVAPICGALSILGCVGDGYMPTTRAAIGQNALCGSTTLSTCGASGLFCAATTAVSDAPYGCR